MIVFVDNYDSFIYNIVQYVGPIDPDLRVFRNDEIDLDGVIKLKPRKIIISPGPGHPDDAGISCEIVKTFFDKIPILGICLGHQAIARAFGGDVDEAPELLHGKSSQIFHKAVGILNGLPNPFTAGRYHSLTVFEETLPDSLEVIAYTSKGDVMGIKHRQYPVYGLQFHPESILTESGEKIIANFLNGDL
ncbi:MAG: aminodeoxychorismate/anthranilate synthase component II [candidate division Zixibacteria bacterium]